MHIETAQRVISSSLQRDFTSGRRSPHFGAPKLSILMENLSSQSTSGKADSGHKLIWKSSLRAQAHLEKQSQSKGSLEKQSQNTSSSVKHSQSISSSGKAVSEHKLIWKSSFRAQAHLEKQSQSTSSSGKAVSEHKLIWKSSLTAQAHLEKHSRSTS